ncbi:MAG: hypothetical protein MHPSP_004929, partial [Paramarteilia canceri]
VKVELKARRIKVTGPNGVLEKVIPCQVTIKKVPGEDKIKVLRYFSSKREKSLINTSASLIENMIIGVTKGFHYTTRAFTDHFPLRFAVKDGVLE